VILCVLSQIFLYHPDLDFWVSQSERTFTLKLKWTVRSLFVEYDEWGSIEHIVLLEKFRVWAFFFNYFLVYKIFDVSEFWDSLSLHDVPRVKVNQELFRVAIFNETAKVAKLLKTCVEPVRQAQMFKSIGQTSEGPLRRAIEESLPDVTVNFLLDLIAVHALLFHGFEKLRLDDD